jgi:hypothetical protein
LTLAPRLSAGPTDRAIIAVLLAKLATLPAQASADTANLRVAAYFDAIGAAPAWAVSEAIKAVFEGRTPFGKPFGPTSVELGELVREAMKFHTTDLAALDGLLAIAKRGEPDPETKQFVADGLDDLRNDLRAGLEGRKEQTFDEAEAALRKRLVANGRDPGDLDRVADAKLPRTMRRLGDVPLEGAS